MQLPANSNMAVSIRAKAEAEEQEREKLDVIRQQEAALAAAKTKAALAKWRRLQVNACVVPVLCLPHACNSMA